MVNELVKRYGKRKMITYTTRPKRKGEVEGKTYHYISEEDFIQKIKDGFFLEYKIFDTTKGKWYYGSAKEDYEKADSNTVTILTPDGYSDLRREIPDMECLVIYLYASNSTIKKRLLSRGDDKAEADRRISADNEDFKGVGLLVDKIVYNNDRDNINDVVDKIAIYMGGACR